MNQKPNRLLSRILVFPSIVLLFTSLVYLSGCKDNNGKDETPTETIWQLIQNTEGLDSLYKYLSTYPDLMTTLQSSGTYTMFAPNNEAFANLMATPGFPSDIKLINPDLIKKVLLYHIADQEFTKGDLTSGASVTTEEQEAITVNDDGTLKTGATNPNIEIDMSNIKATNGIMHTTKSVLIPPTVGATLTPLLGTVAGTLMLGADFSTLAKAIQKADSVVPSGQPSLISLLASTTSQVTVFAPPNDVFTQAQISISDYSGVIWRNIILYHAISGTKSFADLTSRSYTTLMGEKLYVTQTSATDFINGYPIVVPDAAPAANGTVHVLAGFLVPGALLGGDVAGVIGFQSNFDSLAVALDLAGLTNTLKGAGGFTLLAPPNEAFVGLLSSLGLTSLSQIPTSQLAGILSYHIVPGYYFSSDFEDGTQYTTMAGPKVTANVAATGISFTDATGATVPVVSYDLKATNGVIQVIGGILQPQ